MRDLRRGWKVGRKEDGYLRGRRKEGGPHMVTAGGASERVVS